MKLIREEINEAQYIIEEDNGKKAHKIKGIFMQANIKNRNGRVFPWTKHTPCRSQIYINLCRYYV